MTEVSRYCRWALSSTFVALSHSTDAKEAKCNRGAPYIYWGYSRRVLASTIVALSQYGSKPEGVGLLWASQRGKAMTEVIRYCRWALSITFVALSQHGRKAGKV